MSRSDDARFSRVIRDFSVISRREIAHVRAATVDGETLERKHPLSLDIVENCATITMSFIRDAGIFFLFSNKLENVPFLKFF